MSLQRMSPFDLSAPSLHLLFLHVASWKEFIILRKVAKRYFPPSPSTIYTGQRAFMWKKPAGWVSWQSEKNKSLIYFLSQCRLRGSDGEALWAEMLKKSRNFQISATPYNLCNHLTGTVHQFLFSPFVRGLWIFSHF